MRNSPPNFKDLTGTSFGRLIVIGRSDKKNRVHWICKCTCGNEVVLRTDRLKHDNSNSCGCLHPRHGMSKTPFIAIYTNLKARCTNPNIKLYKNYGGRGIKVCDRWMEFVNFRDDMYDSYISHVELHGHQNTSIERIDVNGDYEPSNCTWATRVEQNRNKRNIIRCEVDGEIMSLKEATRKLGLSYWSLREKHKAGVDISHLLKKVDL